MALLPLAARAGETPRLVRMTLKACVDRALEVNPEVRAAAYDVEAAGAKLDEVKAARFLPKFDLTQYFGPSPAARGDLYTARSDWGSLSVFERTEISFVQPLYTWGKGRAAQDAAAAGVSVQTAGVDRRRADLVLRVKELYYGLLLVRQLHDAAVESRDDLKDARAKLLEKIDAGSEEVSYNDLYKLDTFAFKVDQGLHRAEKEMALARAALRTTLALAPADSFEADAEGLEQEAVEVGPLDAYVAKALKDRPEMRGLAAGIEARRAQLRLARSDYYPLVFLGGGAKIGFAPNRDRQSGPFVRDDFNVRQFGALVGLQQSLSFGLTASRVSGARAEYRKILASEKAAREGIALEVERAYRDLLQAGADVESAARALKASRSWMVAARDAFNAGLGETKEMVDAFRAYGEMRVEYYRSIFDYNRSAAILERAAGKE
jgi:outer membrane protein TolC